jgi:hypothetical protein
VADNGLTRISSFGLIQQRHYGMQVMAYTLMNL